VTAFPSSAKKTKKSKEEEKKLVYPHNTRIFRKGRGLDVVEKDRRKRREEEAEEEQVKINFAKGG
jgi:hypothetical protein